VGLLELRVVRVELGVRARAEIEAFVRVGIGEVREAMRPHALGVSERRLPEVPGGRGTGTAYAGGSLARHIPAGRASRAGRGDDRDRHRARGDEADPKRAASRGVSSGGLRSRII
jgi:hypothetical protein